MGNATKPHGRYRTAHLWAIFSWRAAPWVSLTVFFLVGNAQGFELKNVKKGQCDPLAAFFQDGQTLMQVRRSNKDSEMEHVFVAPVNLQDGTRGGDLSGLSAHVNVRSAIGVNKPKWKMQSKVRKGRARTGFGHHGNSGNQTWNILNVSCGSPVTASDVGDAICPNQCPYFAERQVGAGPPCSFMCVNATDCGENGTDSAALVADSDLGSCRRCFVPGCEKCAPSGKDVCAACAKGYLLKNGQCVSTGLITWSIVIAVLSVPVAFILVWLLDLFCRPSVNRVGVEEGHAYRLRAILRRERPAALENASGSSAVHGEDTAEGPYPLSTNLTRDAIAGRGTLLFFNFQRALIVWSLLLLVGWYCTAVLADGFHSDVFKLGNMPAEIPLDYCIIIHWGYQRQHAILWVKWSFCFGSYALSFILALAYSRKQNYTYEKLDAQQTTMMDYAVHVWDLPKESGLDKVEDELQTFLGTHCGENVVGASVCWDTSLSSIDFSEEADDLGRRLSMNSHREELPKELPKEFPEEPSINPIRKAFNWVDSMLCSQPGETGHSCPSRANLVQALRDTTGTGHAFVVFETEAARDRAVGLAQHSSGFVFKGCKIKLEACTCEPESVLWENYSIDDAQVPMRMLVAALTLLGLLIVWVVVFFLPAAYYAIQYLDAKGESPDFLYNILFMLLVIIGNQIMYTASDILSSQIGFKQEDARQSAYVIMYVAACTLNVVMDLACLARTSYAEMVARGVRTDGGKYIGELDHWTQIFEAYAMQREMGLRLASYAFPATFLTPFLLEGLLSNLVPYIVQMNLVRSKRAIVGHYAERSMMHFAPMDLSRYGDILLNVMLTALMFFLPPGFLSSIILYLFLSHIYIYVYDHWRVLRQVPAFSFSNNNVHRAAECLLAVPIGLLLSAGVFKSNCQKLSNGISLPCSEEGWALFGRCFTVFALHVCLHLYLLVRVVPRQMVAKEPSIIPYEVAARTIPQTWFTCNAVHCLRSAYVYNHSTPHILFRAGRT